MADDQKGQTVWYFVVRTWRKKCRTILMTLSESEALQTYEEFSINLRDGDLAIWRCVHEATLQRTSGGYNRTQW
jgi:hypothetical protein